MEADLFKSSVTKLLKEMPKDLEGLYGALCSI